VVRRGSVSRIVSKLRRRRGRKNDGHSRCVSVTWIRVLAWMGCVVSARWIIGYLIRLMILALVGCVVRVSLSR
jgi:hypothetical protein